MYSRRIHNIHFTHLSIVSDWNLIPMDLSFNIFQPKVKKSFYHYFKILTVVFDSTNIENYCDNNDG